VGAIAGFLVWNYPNGLIFLGDGGAYVIGFLIAELSVLLVAHNPPVSPWFPLLLSFYPIFETLFTIFRRMVIGRTHPGLPDAAHLHQLIYRRVVRWAVGSQCHQQKTNRNALTSPYLWVMSTLAVVPATLFWQSTLMLQVFMLIFVGSYVWIYWTIYQARFPKWLSIRQKRER
jgi:UDP-N-acetylmuramyl pentapeptide phosphotransferase/UDP-N-acetylglucosamine-1-phosphate transferase